ncbi:zinc finger MYM-type protein 1-like [Aphis gossypii]|uniref:zinc finger MYM-type protein 1-like n=1 Tax=Aphis gossypii TaxID=80765 RepID=UPI00215902A6|nr:zinc finger MYM-type protein 1-like [Aphis gossypii]XP_050065555.1 zinc finger MYM-type protein 1-like [Aphis gossypii]
MLSILAEIVRSKILRDIKKSNLFSVIIDTTTDVSNKEQFTFLMRYVNEQGNIEERLVALVTAPDSTGHGLFEVFCNITEKYEIDWKKRLCAQAYDGAASMQGKYSGLKTFIQNENPNALYVWCSAHLLNLVIVDTCDCCMVTKVFFGDIRALVEFMRARKRTASFIECQQQLYPTQRIRRLKRFSNTRWTSHDRVIVVVYEKYAALLKALNFIATANDSDRDTSSTAKSLILRMSSYNFVSTMVFIRQIFAITTPLSNYLQSKSIDFIQAIKLVDIAKKRLEDLRLDNNALEKILNEAKQFAFDHKLLEQDFKKIRSRKKKVMPGELSGDDISPSSLDIFKRDVYYKVLDIIINSLDSRFKDSREVMIDLSLLSPERLMSYRKCGGKSLPDDAFQSVSKWIKSIDLNKLKVEYLAFSSSLNELIDGLEPKQLHNSTSTLNTHEDENDSENTYTEKSESEDEESKNENVNVEKILHILSSHDLITAFPNLYTAYKSLGTIPASSASAERSFSKVKLIKTRLRSTVGQNRLESLVLLSTEKDITIDYNEAINKFALTSDLLTKELMFK